MSEPDCMCPKRSALAEANRFAPGMPQTTVYQKAGSWVVASYRKIEVGIARMDPYQTICFGTGAPLVPNQIAIPAETYGFSFLLNPLPCT
jgi:hypothetical protein